MIRAEATVRMAAQPVIYDPSLPVLHFPARRDMVAPTRLNQRARRSLILATIRKLIVDHGLDGITVRRIAESSGHAVQTIYNLVGPRDAAIVEAVSEYTRFVGRSAQPLPEDPYALVGIIECWLRSVAATPQFCRQVGLIYFTPQRNIFYAFRDRELKGMHDFLLRQQRCGVIRSDADIRDLAEQLVLFASALCLEWADRPFPVERLRRRMCAGYANLLGASLAPAGARLRLVADSVG